MRLNIKPMSVNEAWQGKRFKTPRYKAYERDVLLILPRLKVPEGRLAVRIEFGLSSLLADIDNPVKPFVDILQKKYGFNDRQIDMMFLVKTKVDKGNEFIEFEFEEVA